MQHDQVEVAFCDLCGTSVPESDFARGAASRLHGKTVGACCLEQLRPAAKVVTPGNGRASGDGRLVPFAVALLAAMAAATIFLDFQIAGVDRRRSEDHERLAQAQRGDHDAIQRIDVAMDGAARRADLDGLADRMVASLTTAQQDGASVREQVEAMQKEVVGLQREIQKSASASVDYRPLFDELRAQLARQAVAIAALGEVRSVPPAPVEAAAPPPAPDAAAPGDLPAPLVEQVKKLQSGDPAVRFEAVDELLRSKNPAVLTHLMPLTKDPDSFVRRLTLEGLKDHKRAEVVEVLLQALGDADENVRDTAWRSLREVTGQKLPFETTAPKDARARAQQRWQDWWEKNKGSFPS